MKALQLLANLNVTRMETILLIDDEELITESISELLTINGYSVILANNGRDGILMALFHNPDLILVDVMMPIMDGYETVKVLRKNPTFNFTPIIFMSAKAKLEDQRLGFDVGAEDYLIKPVTSKILLEGIRNKLDKFKKIKENNKVSSGLSAHNVYFKAMHEVNTALGGILGSVQILEDFITDLEDSKKIEIIKNIRVSALRVKRIFDNNQWLEKITKNSIILEDKYKEEFSISLLIENILFDLKDEIVNKNLRFETNLNNTRFKLHKSIISKIISELLSNAIKFSKPNSIIKILGTIENDSYLLMIEDETEGFNQLPDLNELLFKQYKRELHEQQGLGLGLYIALSLIEILNLSYSTQKDETPEAKVVSKLIIPIN
jgi:two-component system, sensor histidine kinase and response regulator